MPRVFIVDGRELPDPDEQLSVEEVRRHLAEFLPELANADVREERHGEEVRYTFSRRIGTKGGRRRPDPVALLRRVPARRLRVFELAAELCGPDGAMDVDRAAERRPEVELAIGEAEAYAGETEQAVRRLRELAAR
jgi:PRTRC genetic system protein C